MQPLLMTLPFVTALVALLLGLTMFDAHQAAKRMRVALRISRATATEYERARRDYEQLMRHRIANPLAVVDGGIDTLLRYGDQIDDSTRRDLLLAMADSTRRLRDFTPDPASRTTEEVNLHATPRFARCA